MTEIKYTINDDEFSIVAEGHADYAERGKDIVCAGISCLLQTLIMHVDAQAHITEGRVYCYKKGSEYTECARMCITGLKALECTYRGHLKVSEGCPIIRDFNLQ